MPVLFTAMFSVAPIVWGRYIAGIVFPALAGAAHVPYKPILFLRVIGELLLLSFTLTAFGMIVGARIKQISPG